jgi:hypothetical protein
VERCSPRWAAFPYLPWPWGFFLWSRERRCEVMEEYASGFAEHQGCYFISCESALGVMTGSCRLWEYQTVGFSLRMRRVFIEQCSWFTD